MGERVCVVMCALKCAAIHISACVSRATHTSAYAVGGQVDVHAATRNVGDDCLHNMGSNLRNELLGTCEQCHGSCIGAALYADNLPTSNPAFKVNANSKCDYIVVYYYYNYTATFAVGVDHECRLACFYMLVPEACFSLDWF